MCQARDGERAPGSVWGSRPAWTHVADALRPQLLIQLDVHADLLGLHGLRSERLDLGGARRGGDCQPPRVPSKHTLSSAPPAPTALSRAEAHAAWLQACRAGRQSHGVASGCGRRRTTLMAFGARFLNVAPCSALCRLMVYSRVTTSLVRFLSPAIASGGGVCERPADVIAQRHRSALRQPSASVRLKRTPSLQR